MNVNLGCPGPHLGPSQDVVPHRRPSKVDVEVGVAALYAHQTVPAGVRQEHWWVSSPLHHQWSQLGTLGAGRSYWGLPVIV